MYKFFRCLMLNLLSYANQVRPNNTNVDRLIVTVVSPFTIPHIIDFRYLVIVFSDPIFSSSERRSRALGLISDSYRYISSTKATFSKHMHSQHSPPHFGSLVVDPIPISAHSQNA